MGLLPEKFVQDNLAKAQGAMFMGHPITELSRDELIAMAISGWSAHVNLLNENIRRSEFARGINRERPKFLRIF